jgi:hypothetical protein
MASTSSKASLTSRQKKHKTPQKRLLNPNSRPATITWLLFVVILEKSLPERSRMGDLLLRGDATLNAV